MKILKNKMTVYLLTIIMILALGIASYHTYLSYQRYITVQSDNKLSPFLKQLESVLKQLESERINSVTYLVSQEKRNFQQLQKVRSDVDHTLRELDTFVKDNRVYSKYRKQIKMIATELDKLRRDVDHVDDDYKSILFHAYHNKIFGLLLKILEDLYIAESSEEIERYLSTYKNYTKIKENSVLENTIINFIYLDQQQ